MSEEGAGAAVGTTPVEGRITDESIAEAASRIGTYLRPEGPYLQDATLDTIRNFCNGVGDLNPLFRDAEHGRRSRFGSVIAHPLFPYAYGWPGRSRWGLRGVHGFWAGTDWELFRHVRPGDRLTAVERVVGVEEKEGRFSGRMVIQYVEASFANQRDDLVARVLAWTTRHERRSARERGKYRDIEPHEYSPEEYRAIEEAVLSEPERIRGDRVLYVEDIETGAELPPIARGPLSLMDTIGFLVGTGRGHTHGVLLEGVRRHPDHYFRNPEARGGVEYTGIGHHRDGLAQQVGVPGAYDYGPQRAAWLCSLVTNWMGDDAVLKRLRVDLRRFNVMGDTTWCKGRVERTYVKDGAPLVDLDIWAENQRGEVTARGLATVIVRSRDINIRPVWDGRGCDLGLAVIR
jgi:acyl dehydratase